MYIHDHADQFPQFRPAYSHNALDYYVFNPPGFSVPFELTRKEILGAYLNVATYSGDWGYSLGKTACPKNDVIYYYNEHLLGSDDHGSPDRWGGNPIRMASVLKPSQVFWGGDYLLNQNYYYGHLEGRNVSFVDGHATVVLDQDIQDELWGDNFYSGDKPLTWPY